MARSRYIDGGVGVAVVGAGSIGSLRAEISHRHPAVDFLAGAPRQRLRLIPFERLQEGVDAVHAELRLSPLLLPLKNVTEAVVPLDLTIDPPEEQIVRSLYAADFELHRAIRDCAVSPWPDPPH